MRELLKYSLYVYFSTLFIFLMLSDVDRILLEYTINLEFKLTSVKTGFVPKNWIAFQTAHCFVSCISNYFTVETKTSP